jgi:hypothetical protein
MKLSATQREYLILLTTCGPQWRENRTMIWFDILCHRELIKIVGNAVYITEAGRELADGGAE